MSNPIKIIHNVETGEIIQREMTSDEFAQWENDMASAAAEKQAAIEATAKRQALLDKLGITEDEARLLLGGKN